jgi:hypothetical protein
MAEKVIFEFRADRDEGKCRFEFGRNMADLFESSIAACCDSMGMSAVFCAGQPKQSQRNSNEARHHMRETLDFLEQMYDDLFGERETP